MRQAERKGEMFAISITRAAPSLQKQALEEEETISNEVRAATRESLLARVTQG